MKLKKMGSTLFQESVNNELEKIENLDKIKNILGIKIFDKFKKHQFINLQKENLPNIYHIHNRKTGCTSLNLSFVRLAKGDSLKNYAKLINNPEHILISGKKIFIAWNPKLAESSNFFYSWSSEPYHSIKLKKDVFSVTILRNPYERIVSLYKYLKIVHKQRMVDPSLQQELLQLGSSFEDYLENVPDEVLYRQIYSFSRKLDLKEAYTNILKLSHVVFTEDFARGIESLSRKTGVNLKSMHLRKSDENLIVDKKTEKKLRKILEPSFEFYNMVLKHKKDFYE